MGLVARERLYVFFYFTWANGLRWCGLCRLIQARYNPQLVLTVSIKSTTQCLSEQSSCPGDRHQPSSSESSGAAAAAAAAASASSYAGCALNVQRLKTTQFGRANQRWAYDQSTGLITAFHTDAIDKGKLN